MIENTYVLFRELDEEMSTALILSLVAAFSVVIFLGSIVPLYHKEASSNATSLHDMNIYIYIYIYIWDIVNGVIILNLLLASNGMQSPAYRPSL